MHGLASLVKAVGTAPTIAAQWAERKRELGLGDVDAVDGGEVPFGGFVFGMARRGETFRNVSPTASS